MSVVAKLTKWAHARNMNMERRSGQEEEEDEVVSLLNELRDAMVRHPAIASPNPHTFTGGLHPLSLAWRAPPLPLVSRGVLCCGLQADHEKSKTETANAVAQKSKGEQEALDGFARGRGRRGTAW